MFNKKIIGFFLIGLILIISIGIVSAQDNTTQMLENSTLTLNDEENAITDTQTAIYEADDDNDTIIKKDLDATMEFPDEIPQSMTLNVNNFEIKVNSPEDYNENMSIFVDENLIDECNVKMHWGLYAFEYELGEHTLRVNLPENDFYKELNLTKKFTISQTLLSIGNSDKTIYVGAKTASDVTGTLTVKVNDTVYKNVDLAKTDRASGFSMQINNLDYGTYKITLIYSGDSKYKKAEKTEIITTTYSIEVGNDYIYYFDNKELDIYLPEDIKTKRIDVIIDGEKYPAKYDEYGHFTVDVGNLSFGDIHNYTITYAGDNKYPKNTKTGQITFYTAINYDSLITYGENATVKLNIPTNENGTLYVYMDKKYIVNPTEDLFYATKQLTNGTASINISDLNTGKYFIYARYDGATKVKNIQDSINIFPKIIAPKEINYGDKTTIYAIGDENANGTLQLEFVGSYKDDYGEITDIEKYFSIKMENGKGNVTIKSLPIARFTVSTAFEKDQYISGPPFVLTVKGLTPVLSKNKDLTMYYCDGSTYNVKLKNEYGKYTNNRIVTFKIGETTYKIETDDNGIASLPIKQTPGKYKITATYKGVSITGNILVKKILTLNTVKVKKSASKLILTAKLAKKLKGKTINFKFNGKTYKTKTNSKGIAKVTIKSSVLKKLKVGKKITYQATYQKSTVKKTVKVQK